MAGETQFAPPERIPPVASPLRDKHLFDSLILLAYSGLSTDALIADQCGPAQNGSSSGPGHCCPRPVCSTRPVQNLCYIYTTAYIY